LVCGDFEVFEPVFSWLCDNYVGGDGVAGLEVIECGCGLDGIGHYHGIHKAGDRFVVDVGGSCLFVDGDDSSLKGKALGG
jgi:hypothetical protein